MMSPLPFAICSKLCPCTVHIIGVPLDLGGGRRGVDMGPSAFRIAGLGDRLAALGYAIVDKGDLAAPIPETQKQRDERKKYINDIARVCQKLYQMSLASLDAGAMPIVLGGDHSLAAGSVAASADWAKKTANQPIGLLWIDAHGDMNTPATSLSGNVHGMPLAALLGNEPAELVEDRRLQSEGAAGAHRDHRRAQSGRARKGRRAGFARARLHDEGHRSPGYRVHRRAGRQPGGQRHRGHSRVVRHGRLRSAHRARRRDTRQGRSRLPRGAHGDGNRRRLRTA